MWDLREMCLHRQETLSFCFSGITATKKEIFAPCITPNNVAQITSRKSNISLYSCTISSHSCKQVHKIFISRGGWFFCHCLFCFLRAMLFQKAYNSSQKLGQNLNWYSTKNEHTHLQDLCKPVFVRPPTQITTWSGSKQLFCIFFICRPVSQHAWSN